MFAGGPLLPERINCDRDDVAGTTDVHEFIVELRRLNVARHGHDLSCQIHNLRGHGQDLDRTVERLIGDLYWNRPDIIDAFTGCEGRFSDEVGRADNAFSSQSPRMIGGLERQSGGFASVVLATVIQLESAKAANPAINIYRMLIL